MRTTAINLCRLMMGCVITPWILLSTVLGQSYGPPDRGEPGDVMIQEYLQRESRRIHQRFLDGVASLDDWQDRRGRWMEEYFYMLGLWPLPERTALQPTVTGTHTGDGFVVEKLHYQSRPRLYVTANLYRPSEIESGERLPAVLYVCGHSHRGRNGNKTAYQSHGIWLARHGYICLIVDTLQLGEIAAIHHGTYREQRWWWHSRGYTPAGVECWNGVRGIDYLVSRPDVDPERIGVTGISGGGAATLWIAPADERVKVAVPVSGMADLISYVPNRVINGHCDCMFLYNTFRWPWTRIAGLVAPRPLLFVNSDQDPIFPMDANQRVINRLERVYSLYGAGDMVDSVVSIGGHAYRRDIRRAAFRFLNLHLKEDPRVVEDSEVDLVSGSGSDRRHPIPPEQLRVFPKDSDIPADELNTTIDQHFVPVAQVPLPETGEVDPWRRERVSELRRVTFGYFPERIPTARPVTNGDGEPHDLETEPGIHVRLTHNDASTSADQPSRVLLLVSLEHSPEQTSETPWIERVRRQNDRLYCIQPRGIGPTRWTRKNPPNYVRRSHVLLGRTVDTGRVWDVIATARYLHHRHRDAEIHLAGDGAASLIAAYAALLEETIAGVVARQPPTTHMDSSAPQLLNVMRVCDAQHVLGMLAPRPLIVQEPSGDLDTVAAIYAAAGATDRLTRSTSPAASDGHSEPGR